VDEPPWLDAPVLADLEPMEDSFSFTSTSDTPDDLLDGVIQGGWERVEIDSEPFADDEPFMFDDSQSAEPPSAEPPSAEPPSAEPPSAEDDELFMDERFAEDDPEELPIERPVRVASEELSDAPTVETRSASPPPAIFAVPTPLPHEDAPTVFDESPMRSPPVLDPGPEDETVATFEPPAGVADAAPRWAGIRGVTGDEAREAELGSGKWSETGSRSIEELRMRMPEGAPRELELEEDSGNLTAIAALAVLAMVLAAAFYFGSRLEPAPASAGGETTTTTEADTARVTVTTVPEGAQITFGGRAIGLAPAEVAVPADDVRTELCGQIGERRHCRSVTGAELSARDPFVFELELSN